MRVFDSGRKAALAAAAGDDDGIPRHASAAIAAYRGELLPGVYEDWLLDARAQLERQCVDVCDLVCAGRARTGDLAGVVEAARRRVQLQPLEEVGYRTLMELQRDLGDRAGAVSTYHHCASVLERELGVAPDPATRKACHEIGEKGMVIAGPVFYDLADIGAVMRWYRELVPSLPEELSGWIAVLTVPPVPMFPEALWGRKVCGIAQQQRGERTMQAEPDAVITQLEALIGAEHFTIKALRAGRKLVRVLDPRVVTWGSSGCQAAHEYSLIRPVPWQNSSTASRV